MSELSGALAGSESARTADDLGPRWEDTTDEWAKGMDSYATALYVVGLLPVHCPTMGDYSVGFTCCRYDLTGSRWHT